MRTNKLNVILKGFMIISILMLMSCSQDKSLAPDAISPTESSTPLGSLMKGPVVESVTGSGSFIFQSNNRTFSFTARRFADGSVAGQWERVNHIGNASQTKSHGKVTCLTIIGPNQARLGGFATSGVASAPPNNEVAWRVEDNGQGANSPGDQISAQFFIGPPGFAANFCTTGLPFIGLNPIVQGNIQVRP